MLTNYQIRDLLLKRIPRHIRSADVASYLAAFLTGAVAHHMPAWSVAFWASLVVGLVVTGVIYIQQVAYKPVLKLQDAEGNWCHYCVQTATVGSWSDLIKEPEKALIARYVFQQDTAWRHFMLLHAIRDRMPWVKQNSLKDIRYVWMCCGEAE